MNIQIRIEDTGELETNGVITRRVKYSAVNAVGIDPNIFLVRQRGEDAEFVTVCLAADMDNIPANAPAEDAEDPLYRTDEFFVTTNVPSLLVELESGVSRRVLMLLNARKVIDSYVAVKTLSFSV